MKKTATIEDSRLQELEFAMLTGFFDDEEMAERAVEFVGSRTPDVHEAFLFVESNGIYLYKNRDAEDVTWEFIIPAFETAADNGWIDQTKVRLLKEQFKRIDNERE